MVKSSLVTTNISIGLTIPYKGSFIPMPNYCAKWWEGGGGRSMFNVYTMSFTVFWYFG